MSDWIVRPSLAEPIDNDEAGMTLLRDPHYHAEQKLDGDRLLIHIHENHVVGINRKGSVVNIPQGIGEAFQWFDGEWVFDGELIGKTYWVFDMPRALDIVKPSQPYSIRRSLLQQLWPKIALGDQVGLLRSETDTEAKTLLVQDVHTRGGEGVMFKDGRAPYAVGRRTRDNLKWKFWKSVDCIVLERWREGKQSMAVGVVDPETSEIIDIGSVKMTPANMEKVDVGSVVEVRYLYVENLATPRLYQPDFQRVRLDKDPPECVLSQLKVTSRTVV